MKKLLLLLTSIILCISIAVNAQTDSSIIQKSEYIVQHLNKANIPTGVLYDMIPFAYKLKNTTFTLKLFI